MLVANLTIYVKEAVNEQPIQSLESVLSQIEGIERALVDTADGEVKIEYNETQVSPEKIRETVLQHGLNLQD
ncbi:heavy-metal-associated domain-containing protein [Bacillus sp. ISL-18]|uniref:heavy-metal-associated domain-containing protein n=1 Tax=Bacillus sp. ISL-18 TaxID=2819118 RepID=UPI002035474A|nr:cation transporter [Bacillus sp. ISL-18]